MVVGTPPLDPQDDTRIQRVSCAPIIGLHEDLLHEIFSHLVECCPLSIWFPINLVCRTWRLVALGAPRLWCRPPTHHHDMTLVMLERSKLADLTIFLGKKTSVSTTAAIMGQMGRIQSLSIKQPGALLVSTCIGIQNSIHEASHLEEVAIELTHNVDGQVVPVSSIPFQQLPRLRKLKFVNITFDWKILRLPHLRDLSLIKSSAAEITTQRFLEALAQMPHLERLDVDSHTLSRRADMPLSQTLEDITLPNLSSADISCATLPQLTAVLSRTILPQLRHLRIYMWLYNDDDHPPWVDALSSAMTRGNFEACKTLVLQSQSLQITRMSGNKIDFSDGLQLFLLGVISVGHIVSSVVARLHDQILLRITELILDGSHPNQIFDLLVERLPHLQSISVQTLHIPVLISVLSQHPTGSLFDTTSNPFPNLTTVAFRDNNQGHSIWEGFIGCLRVRRRYGSPIKKIVISQKSLGPPSDTMASLHELGVELEEVAKMY